jgi:hypothetical protein
VTGKGRKKKCKGEIEKRNCKRGKTKGKTAREG